MSERGKNLAQRRAGLQLRAAAQRRQLGQLFESIDSRVRTVDQGIVNARSFLRRPALLMGGAAVALLVGPRRILRLAGQSVLLVGTVRRLLRYVRF